MRAFRNPLWLLVVTGLVVAGGVTALLLNLHPIPAVTMTMDEVRVSREANAPARLLVTGQGLHDGLQAMLIPDQSGSPLADQFSLPIPTYKLATKADLAVATMRNHRLLVLEVAPGRPPAVVGNVGMTPQPEFPSGKTIDAVAMSGSMVVVSRRNFGLTLIDVADPTQPRQVDHLAAQANYTDMEPAAGLIYAVSTDEGLAVLSLAGGRLHPRSIPENPRAWRVAVNGRRLVAASRKGELTLYQLDSQGWPHPAGTFKVAQEIRDLSLSGEALYLCTASGQLLEYALRDWPRPVLIGRLQLQGRPLRMEWAEETRRLTCSLVESGLETIDTSQPGSPSSAGVMSTPTAPLAHKFSNGRLVLGGSGGLWIASAAATLEQRSLPESVYPFTKPVGSVALVPWNGAVLAYDLEGLAPLTGNPEPLPTGGVAQRKRLPLLALPGRAEVRLHAESNGLPSREPLARLPVADPEVTDSADEINLIRGLFWQAGRLFVLTPYRLKIFACDPTGVEALVGEYRLPGEAVAMDWLEPGFVVVGLRLKGVQLIDVRNPAAPLLAGDYPIPKHLRSIGSVTDVLVDARRLFVARGRLGVESYDVSDPSALKLTQRITTSGYALKLSLDDGLLTVNNQDKRVFVIDVRGEIGQPVGSYPLPALARAILNFRGRLFVANAAGGVMNLPAPQRLDVKVASDSKLAIAVPADLPAGRYTLALYADGDVTSMPVVLP